MKKTGEMPPWLEIAKQFVDELIDEELPSDEIISALVYSVSTAAHRCESPLVIYSMLRGIIDGCIEDQIQDQAAPKTDSSSEQLD